MILTFKKCSVFYQGAKVFSRKKEMAFVISKVGEFGDRVHLHLQLTKTYSSVFTFGKCDLEFTSEGIFII